MPAENEDQTQVTQLLGRIRGGDRAAEDSLLEVVYDELRGLASALYAPHRHRQTLQPTALVHEAWLKLAGHLDSIESRRHFFAIAAKAMRQVLANMVRDAQREKRGGGRATIMLDEAITVLPQQESNGEIDLVALEESLTKLAEKNERHARVVELRLLGTMTMQEISDELQVSKRTVEDDWLFARQWLRVELGKSV